MFPFVFFLHNIFLIIFFGIFMSFLFFLFIFFFFGCFRQFCFCRNTLQNSYSEEKYCDLRASNLIIQRLSLCLHDKSDCHANKSHNYHLEKKREREKTKNDKSREVALLAKMWRFLNRSERIGSAGPILLVSIRDPIGPPRVRIQAFVIVMLTS